MNTEIIRRWNDAVRPEDDVFILGDLALGKIDVSLGLVEQLVGNKYLVPGNHDRCWSGNKKIREVDVSRYTDVGITILGEDIDYQIWRLCHFPYEGDSHDEDRYVKHRPTPRFDNEWLLHGHVHEKWKVNGNQINVGVDVWDYRPVVDYELSNLMLALSTSRSST